MEFKKRILALTACLIFTVSMVAQNSLIDLDTQTTTQIDHKKIRRPGQGSTGQ